MRLFLFTLGLSLAGCEGSFEESSGWDPASWGPSALSPGTFHAVAREPVAKALPEPIPSPAPVVTPAEEGPPFEAPNIDVWQAQLRRCYRRPRRYCNGPRFVPMPRGEGRARARRLELGTRRAYDVILSGPAREELLAEAGTPEDTLVWPVPEGTMGRGFGFVRRARIRSKLHRGVDIPAAVGALVRGANDGLVIYADNEIRGYGNLVVILHGDDSRTFYAHLDRAFVFAGEQIERGQVIGAVGRTGMTRAPHLHFEYRRRAVPRNPARLFVDRPSPEEEQRLLNDQLERRREGEAQLAEWRARAERRRNRHEREAGDEAATRSDGT